MRIKSKEKKIKVRLQLGRDNNRKWHLRIEDEASGLRILEVNFDHEQLSNLISTMETEPCDAEYFGEKEIGKKLEVKTVLVEVQPILKIFESYNETQRTSDLQYLYNLAEERNPGWKADRDKNYSYNKHDMQNATYTITLRRYVRYKE